MTTVIQEKTQREGPDDQINLNAPKGWFVPEPQIAVINDHARVVENYRQSVTYNLPLVAKRTEELIDALYDRFMIPVRISYLRIDEGTSFHVMLLVDQYDYLSPKIHAARLMAEQFTHKNDTFDVRFKFSIKSENMMVDAMLAQGYKLIHISEQEQEAA